MIRILPAILTTTQPLVMWPGQAGGYPGPSPIGSGRPGLILTAIVPILDWSSMLRLYAPYVAPPLPSLDAYPDPFAATSRLKGS